MRKRSLLRQQHSDLPQAILNKSQVASNFIDKSVQDFSDVDEESEESSNPEFVFTSHKRKII